MIMRNQKTIQVFLDVVEGEIVNITCNDPDIVFYISKEGKDPSGPYSPDYFIENPLEVYKKSNIESID